MPTYDYKCLDCDHRFEAVQRMTADALTTCPECEGKLKRLIGTGAGIIFKGSGFYETDYRSESYKSGAKKDKEASKKPEPKKEKPAKKAKAD
ncbi:MAG: putative FmdB family regulatory protein [Rhodothermales bacterium]|jgi:putative FmdB family regulatory protein